MFGLSGGDTTPLFEMQEGVLDEMPQSIECLAIFPGLFTVSLRRDNRLHASRCSLLNDSVGIVCLIGQQHFRRYAVNQGNGLGAIRDGTCRNNRSERHTLPIHGQRYLAVEPPFVRFMA